MHRNVCAVGNATWPDQLSRHTTFTFLSGPFHQLTTARHRARFLTELCVTSSTNLVDRTNCLTCMQFTRSACLNFRTCPPIPPLQSIRAINRNVASCIKRRGELAKELRVIATSVDIRGRARRPGDVMNVMRRPRAPLFTNKRRHDTVRAAQLSRPLSSSNWRN